jgi:uncharacterized protein (TIGR01615 family)
MGECRRFLWVKTTYMRRQHVDAHANEADTRTYTSRPRLFEGDHMEFGSDLLRPAPTRKSKQQPKEQTPARVCAALRAQDATQRLTMLLRELSRGEGVRGTEGEQSWGDEDVFQQDDLMLFQQDEECAEDDGEAVAAGESQPAPPSGSTCRNSLLTLPRGLADAVSHLAHAVTHVWRALPPCRGRDSDSSRLLSLGHFLSKHTGLGVRLRRGVAPPPVTAASSLVGGCRSPAAAAAARARQAAMGSQLSHAFLLVDLQPRDAHAADQHGRQRDSSSVLIVDPLFRDQLRLGLADAEYARLLDTDMPEVFVGTAGQMGALLSVATTAVAAAYSRASVPVPVWRSARAVASKWLPATFTDEALGPRGSSSSRAPQPQRQVAPPPAPAAGPASPGVGVAPGKPLRVVVGFNLAGSTPAAAGGIGSVPPHAAEHAPSRMQFASFSPFLRSGTSTSLSSSIRCAVGSVHSTYLRSLSIVQ